MLRIDKLSKTYNPGLVNSMALFRDFSLEIKKEQFVTVVGSNGSGKTSLLNLICGSLPFDEGRIYLSGDDISRQPEFERAKKIGRVYQDPSRGTCPSMTILENMSMADNKGGSFNLRFCVSKKKIDYYKTLVQKLKMGLENKMDTQVGELSGGQRQALALLISTLTPIDLLILDEHTAALDPQACEIVMELTNEIVQEHKMTALMVTHNIKYAVCYGDRILMMHKGEAILDKAGEAKAVITVGSILDIFTEISVELGN